jgi:hypothetical protein
MRLFSVERISQWLRLLEAGRAAATLQGLGFDLAIIRHLAAGKLYRHLGFVPFGPVVGSGEAQFQPMYPP